MDCAIVSVPASRAEAAIEVGGRAAVDDGMGDDGEDSSSLVVGTLLPLYEELAANTQPVSFILHELSMNIYMLT